MLNICIAVVKDRTVDAQKYFLETLDAVNELCEGVPMPRDDLDYIHYFCGENGINEADDEAFARSREKFYKLVARLLRAYEEFKPRMDDAGVTADEQTKFEQQSRQSERKFVSGETIYVLGQQYFLRVEYSYKGNSLILSGNEAVLTVRKESTAKQREAFVNEWYRSLLKEKIETYLLKWENLTGLHCDSWQTKYMTTRWGTCNTNTRKIWLNLQLAKKPIECLEYVILHELAHLKVRDHGKDFIAIMDRFMPYWRETRKLLNDLKLDYMED